MDKGFCYEQGTGELWLVNGCYSGPIAAGFSGRNSGRNNPDDQSIRNHGPLPQGEYTMWNVEHPRFKSPAIALKQVAGETFGRSGFYIHGGTESAGCIILDRPTRQCVLALMGIGFRRLKVIP